MKIKIIVLLGLLLITVCLFSEDFDIKKFSDPKKYGWDTPDILYDARDNLYNRQKLLQIYEMKNQSITANLIKSAIAPGWGHFSSGQYTKGQVLLGMEIILLGTSYYYFDSAMEKYDKYKNATYIKDIDQYYEDAKDSYFISQIFFTLGTVVWLYTIYDSIDATESYNVSLWKQIILQYQSSNLTITPTGFTWRF